MDVTGGPLGFLDITNGGGEDSEVTILWNLTTGLVPANALNIGFYFAILQSDGNPTSLDFSFSSNPLASFSIPGNTANQNVSFGLTPAQIALVSAGGPLELKINGAAGWDLSVDAFGFSYDQPVTPPTNNVPEPAAFALLAAGLAGFAAARKKKQA
ncbi:MAG: PEP-CTERM sorting domain-containing protein [Methylococcaceae bacterium]|nr:PEP-CTERM sorting domain-containing protein [Methylococcaceae bacterium]